MGFDENEIQETRRGVSTAGKLMVELHAGSSHPSGFEVVASSLSDEGVSFFHGMFVYPGSMCRVHLPIAEGRVDQVVGRVMWCKSVSGAVHEVGVVFERPHAAAAMAKS